MELHGYHATDRQFDPDELDPLSWFSTSRDAVDFYWSGPECGGQIIERDFIFQNPLVISSDEFAAAFPSGPVSFLHRAMVQENDAVVLLDIQDGDMVSTVFVPIQ